MVVRACSPSYSGGWGRRIAWTQEAEVAVSRDRAISLQPGGQEWNFISKNKKIRGNEKTLRDCYKHLYAYKLENTEEMDKFLETSQDWSGRNWNPCNSPVTSSKIESLVKKTYQPEKALDYMESWPKST